MSAEAPARAEPAAPASDDRPVVVVEPQFKGAVHASFNAGLLLTAHLAFPQAPIVFLGDRDQVRWVRDALGHLAPDAAPEVEWGVIQVPGALRRLGRIRRTLAEVGGFLRALGRARRRHARLVLFCSLPRIGAVTLVLFARRICPRTVVLAVVHDVGGLLPSVSDLRTAAARLYHRVLRLAPPANLRLVAPTALAHRELAAVDPALARLFTPLPLPYPWRRCESPADLRPRAGGALRFGLIGAGSPDRLEPFCRVARDLKRRFPEARFVLVGHLTEAARDLGEQIAILDDAPEEPLPLDRLARSIDALDYAVWIGTSETYRWRLSASFLDALSHVKPSLALETPYSSFMFETMGDIGYLCADPDDLTATAERLLEDFPRERYARQCANIAERRSSLAPTTVAAILRNATLGLAADRSPGLS